MAGITSNSAVAVLIAIALGACTTKPPDSDLSGVGDGGKNSIALIAVRNAVGIDPEAAADSENLGNAYARDLISMRLFALVQCATVGDITADQRMFQLQGRAELDQVFVDAERRLVLTDAQTGKPTVSTPCAVMSTHLLSFPVIAKTLNLARSGAILTKETMAAAQFFYLSLKGFEDRNDKQGVSPMMMAYADLAREHLGASAPTVNNIIAGLRELDPILNPCSKSRSSKVKPEVAKWRDENFSCVAVEDVPDVYSFVPTERANFAKLRDAAAARIATLHVTLYGDDEVIASESNHSKLWQVLTSTRELRSLAKDPVLGSVAGVLNGKAEKFRSIFASDEYGDVQPKLELEEIEDVASGFGLTGAAPKAQNPGVEQAILQYAKTNKITRDQAYAKLKAMPKSQQQSALAKAAADAKAATTPAQPSSAGRAVQGAPTKFTEITPAGKEALSKQLTVDKFNETLNAAAALQRPTNMQAAVESYGRAGLNSKVEDLNAMYAIAKAQGQDVTALEKAAETKGIKLDKTWTVQGLSGGKNNNEYVQVTGSKGELHFRNVQSGATQTWVKPDEKFSNEALKSIKDKGVSSTGPEKTAANTSVTFDVNRTMYVEGGAVQAGRWRADTVDGNKGVVATTLGTKFNDGKDGVMVPYKTSLKDNLVTIDTTGKAGEEARANTTQALAAANANLRKEGLAYCNKAKELEAQAAALQGKLDSVTNEYINPENDHSNKVTDGALKDSMAAIKKQQDDLRAQAKQFNVALEANKVEQEKNIKIAEETGLYDDDKLKAELQAERDKIKTTCGTGSALVGFDLQGCDPAEAVAANPDGTKTLEASDLPVDQKAESTPTPGGDDAPGDATAAKGDTSTAGESSTASEPASGPTATAAASDATVVPTTADPSAFPGANPVVEETKEFVDPQGNDPMVTAEPLDSLAATRADAAVGAAEAAAGAIDKSAAGDTSTFAKPGGGFNTNLMGNEIMGASVDPLAPVAMDFSNVSNGSTLGTAGGGQVPVDVDASFFGPVDNAVSSNSSPTLYSDPFTAAPASDDFMTFDNVQSPPSNSPPYSFPATDPVSYDAPVFHDTTSYADSFPPAEPDYGAMAGDPAPMPEMSSPAPSYDAPMEMGPSDGTMMSLTDDEPSAKPAVQEGDK